MRPKKRAIALAGGGPAAGLHIGALLALEEAGIDFDVWSLSCIGAWVGIYYNQLAVQDRAAETYKFFRKNAFRDSDSYRGFPVNKAFAPNLGAYAAAWWKHAVSPQSLVDMLCVGNEVGDVIEGWSQFLSEPRRWTRAGDVNAHVLNDILAVHPASRFLTSLLYQSEVNGLSNIYFKDSSFLDSIAIGSLDLLDVSGGLDSLSREDLEWLLTAKKPAPEREAIPEIYHNAWRLADDRGTEGKLQLFNNKWWRHRQKVRPKDYLPITNASLCACSALPYIEQTVQIPNDGNRNYSEGALVDTVSFSHLLDDHPNLDEIWVCRIVDYRQIRYPRNLHDSLGNLCEQFAAEVGENDIKIFRNHLRKSAGRIPRIVEVPLNVKTKVGYRWDHENLDNGVDEGYTAVTQILTGELVSPTTDAPIWP